MTPLHIAIIPDGNRRWAKKRLLQPWKGHEESAKNLAKLLEWVGDDGRIDVLTFWTFSTENWKREPKEVEKLMEMLGQYLTKEKEALREKKIRLIHSGRTDRLSPELKTLLDDVCAYTNRDGGYTLHLALDYGGKDEIVRAIGKMQPGTEVTEETIREHLDHPELPDIDLIVRTSGEQRTSNFALWQSAYAEWIFIDKYFPDFTGEDLGTAIDGFTQRKRRFGT